MSLKKKMIHNLFAYEWWSILYNPFHITRRKLLKGFQAQSPHLKGKLLDFGCGAKPYRSLFPTTEYVGCDVQKSGHDHSNEQIDFYYDGHVIPKPNDSFDCVFTSEVLEHIFNPDQILSEIHRVLIPNGVLLVSCPFFWNEHEVPYDYCRYSSFGLKGLLERNGFRVEQQLKTGNRQSVLFQLLNLMVYESLRFHPKAWLLGAPVYALANFVEGLIGKFTSDDSLYLSNVVLARKLPV